MEQETEIGLSLAWVSIIGFLGNVTVCFNRGFCVCMGQYNQWFCSAVESGAQAVFAQGFDTAAQSAVSQHVSSAGQPFTNCIHFVTV